MDNRVVMFCFAGRQENMVLQLPYIWHVLNKYPNVEYHLWNLARNEDDANWLQAADDNHSRITIFNQFYGRIDGSGFNEVYRFYTQEEYADCVFIKLDDDVVFFEADNLDKFVQSVLSNPQQITSAKVINNGAGTASDPNLTRVWQGCSPGLNLLDVHFSTKYLLATHEYFINNWMTYVDKFEPSKQCYDWLSINFIGYTWPIACQIARTLCTPSLPIIAGRKFRKHTRLGDEGVVNMFPRRITRGFIAAHLTFGPQERRLPEHQLNDLRASYLNIQKAYLM